MDFEIVLESFQRWFMGAQLTSDDTTNIVMGIILVVLLIVLIVMLTIISIQSLFWTRIGWFFEDVWHWFQRTTDLTSRHYDEDLNDEEIHEIMNIIHKDNSPKKEKEITPKILNNNENNFSDHDGPRADDRSAGTAG